MLENLGSCTFFPEVLLHILYKSSLQLNPTYTEEFPWALDGFLFHPFPAPPFGPCPLFHSQKRNLIIKPTQFLFLHIWKFLWEFSDFCEPTIMVSGKLRAVSWPSFVFHHHFILNPAVSYCGGYASFHVRRFDKFFLCWFALLFFFKPMKGSFNGVDTACSLEPHCLASGLCHLLALRLGVRYSVSMVFVSQSVTCLSDRVVTKIKSGDIWKAFRIISNI